MAGGEGMTWLILSAIGEEWGDNRGVDPRGDFCMRGEWGDEFKLLGEAIGRGDVRPFGDIFLGDDGDTAWWSGGEGGRVGGLALRSNKTSGTFEFRD